MNNLLLYLLKVSAGTTLMYMGYLLFFRRDTFYLRNRILLLLTLIIPTILPAIRIPVISGPVASVEPVEVISKIIYSEPAVQTAVTGIVQNSFDFYSLSGWIYFTVAALLILKVFISLLSTYTIIKKGTVKNSNFPKVVISHDNLPPFSFFPYAVIPAEDYNRGNYDDVLEHEFAHIKQRHTFDLLLSELFVAFQWFNPFIWFIKRSIILNHEFLADKVSLVRNKCSKEYQYRLLNLQPALRPVPFAHSFDSLIKNRIIMINKKPTPKLARLKNIVILPIVAIAVYAFATPDYKSSASPNPENSVILQNQVKGTLVSEDGKPSVSPNAETAVVPQNQVKGIVVSEVGKPMEKVNISTIGSSGSNASATDRIAFSLDPDTGKQIQPLSKSSEIALQKFIYSNINYPQSAKDAWDTGKVFVAVRLTKGGVIKECKAFTESNEIKTAVLNEVVVVGYGQSNKQNSAAPKSGGSNDHPSLKTESQRIANKLTVNEIPEWKENNLEFTLAIKFDLK